MGEKIEFQKVDEKIEYTEFKKPTFDIYDEKINEKMAKVFIALGKQPEKEGEIDA